MYNKKRLGFLLIACTLLLISTQAQERKFVVLEGICSMANG